MGSQCSCMKNLLLQLLPALLVGPGGGGSPVIAVSGSKTKE